MRSWATASLLLALGAEAQDRPRPVTIDVLVRALGEAKDEESVRKALEPIDALSVQMLSSLRREAARQGEAAFDAVRRHLPHPAWYAVLSTGDIGAMRRRELELLGPAARAGPEAFAGAVGRLLDHEDAAVRLVGLKLLGSVRAPDPAKLAPFLAGEDFTAAMAAALALSRLGGPIASREIAAALTRKPLHASTLAFVASGALEPSATPELLELLKTRGGRAAAVLRVFVKTADARAEAPLLELLGKDGVDHESLGEALVSTGGEAARAALRDTLASLPPQDPRRPPVLSALVGLRAPGTSALVLREVAEGRLRLGAAKAWLERLGDRAAVPALAEAARAKETRIEDRGAALELLGALGAAEHRELLEEKLADPRFATAAAAGLEELGDPRSARPLAVALKTATHPDGSRAAGALLHLRRPIEGVEAELQEILDDPQGHPMGGATALQVAAVVRSPAMKAYLFRRLLGENWGAFGPVGWALALIPHLEEADLDRLRHATVSGGIRSHAVALARAALGDADGLGIVLEEAARDRFSVQAYNRGPGLEAWPVPERLLGAVVPQLLAAHPAWFDGAEWLAKRGPDAGAALLRKELLAPTRTDRGRRALDALVALRDRSWLRDVPRLLEAAPETFRDSPPLAALLDDDAVRALRVRVRESLDEVGRSPAARLLAFRADLELAPHFVTSLRIAHNEAYSSSNDAAFAEALARLRVPEALPILRRWLREPWPTRRAVALRALALAGDPAAIDAIAPLLDDLEPRPQERERTLLGRTPRVRDAAAEAVSVLAGVKFEGRPEERVKAARDWCAAQRK